MYLGSGEAADCRLNSPRAIWPLTQWGCHPNSLICPWYVQSDVTITLLLIKASALSLKTVASSSSDHATVIHFLYSTIATLRFAQQVQNFSNYSLHLTRNKQTWLTQSVDKTAIEITVNCDRARNIHWSRSVTNHINLMHSRLHSVTFHYNCQHVLKFKKPCNLRPDDNKQTAADRWLRSILECIKGMCCSPVTICCRTTSSSIHHYLWLPFLFSCQAGEPCSLWSRLRPAGRTETTECRLGWRTDVIIIIIITQVDDVTQVTGTGALMK